MKSIEFLWRTQFFSLQGYTSTLFPHMLTKSRRGLIIFRPVLILIVFFQRSRDCNHNSFLNENLSELLVGSCVDSGLQVILLQFMPIFQTLCVIPLGRAITSAFPLLDLACQLEPSDSPQAPTKMALPPSVQSTLSRQRSSSLLISVNRNFDKSSC